jgi:acyl-CoA synthetase (AMP-forming)/AMP-acid ligase II
VTEAIGELAERFPDYECLTSLDRPWEEDAEVLRELARSVRREVARTIGLGIRHIHLVPPGGITKTTSGKLAREATRARYPEVFGSER